MGERIALGLVAVVVACGLSSAAAPVQAVTAEAAPVEYHPTYDIDPDLADKFVAETPRGAVAETVARPWDCSLTLNLDYAAGPGVDVKKLREQMAYPVRYLQNLGYVAAIGNEVPYAPNMPMPATPGIVLVVATNNRAEQSGLASGTHRAFGEDNGAGGRISVMATNGMASDVILHELGHILGLQHKPGTVMAEGATDSVSFDPSETAAIDCR